MAAEGTREGAYREIGIGQILEVLRKVAGMGVWNEVKKRQRPVELASGSMTAARLQRRKTAALEPSIAAERR